MKMSSAAASVPVTKAEALSLARTIDWLIVAAAFGAFTGSFHIHAMLTMGDWDFWVDWKDRRQWPTVTPIVLVTYMAAGQYVFWEKFRLPFGATFLAACLMFGEWVNRYFNFWGWTYFPLNLVIPATIIPGALLLDTTLLISRNFLITAIFGALSWGLIFYPGNWYWLGPWHEPVEVHGMVMSLADLQGYTYIRTSTPEYIRIIEKGTLRTFGKDVVPVAAFFSGFMSMLVYFWWWFVGKFFCQDKFYAAT
jgi:methane/ammonia monooxygenase subunit A